MSGYEDYEAHMAGLAKPSPMPDHMPVMYAAALGRPIIRAHVEDDILRIEFEGGGTLMVWDNGQSCCESRYMTTDDELDTFAGAKVVSIEEVNGPDLPYGEHGGGDVHEQTFVKLETTMGTITLVTHNEHNGYYGGFNVVSRWED